MSETARKKAFLDLQKRQVAHGHEDAGVQFRQNHNKPIASAPAEEEEDMDEMLRRMIAPSANKNTKSENSGYTAVVIPSQML